MARSVGHPGDYKGHKFMTIMVTMSRASISDLKARLSHYLREVRRGGEIEILDRGVPVARLTGIDLLGETASDERRKRLIQSGVLSQRASEPSALLEEPPIEASASILEALEEERADRL